MAYPVSIKAVIGEPVRLVGSDVVAVGGRIGSVTLGGSGVLARMASASGEWALRRRRRWGWHLLIEGQDYQHVGWYEGRPWLAGGTISLIDGTQADLRRAWTLSPLASWKLQATDMSERYADLRCPMSWSEQGLTFTISSLPHTVLADLVVLTACAVVRLEQLVAEQAAMMCSHGC